MSERNTGLTHLDEAGQVRMVDVSGKEPSLREAVARGQVTMAPRTLELIRRAALPKGDVLAVARVAGIMAAKEAARLIPLCHPLPLDHVQVDLRLEDPSVAAPGATAEDATARVLIQATVRTRAPTGAEMEALTAVMGAALAVYDMCKGVDRDMVIGQVRLVRKEGGRSGRWQRGGEEPWPSSEKSELGS